MAMRRMRRPPFIWFGGACLADVILGMDGDQTVHRTEVPEKQHPEEGISGSDSEKKLALDPEKQ